MIAKVAGESSSSPLGAAPAIPRPGGLAPPVPPGGSRGRSNSDQSGREGSGSMGLEAPLQLGGLFAGGMPKLKKRDGGIDTGGQFHKVSKWIVN
jgi:hypothetical protein